LEGIEHHHASDGRGQPAFDARENDLACRTMNAPDAEEHALVVRIIVKERATASIPLQPRTCVRREQFRKPVAKIAFAVAVFESTERLGAPHRSAHARSCGFRERRYLRSRSALTAPEP